MRLKKSQKIKVIEWIAEGLQTDEINKLAEEYNDPFRVSRQQVDHYRKTRKIQIEAIKSVDETNALTTGLSKAEERVKRLQQLAEMLWSDISGGFLWLEDVKGVGSGEVAEVVEFEKFNQSEVSEFRAILEDIAKEVGGRVQKTDITSGGEIIRVTIKGEDGD